MMDDDDPMIEIRASFFVECEELLEALQDGLQIMDDGEATHTAAGNDQREWTVLWTAPPSSAPCR